MEALLCTKPGIVEYVELPKPELRQDHVIIRVKRIGITDADMMGMRGNYPQMKYPRVLGAAIADELVAIDNAPGFQTKEKVTILPYLNCNICFACLSGNTNCCVNLKSIGIDINGGMAEYLMVPSSNLFRGSGLTLEELASVTPIAVAAHSINRARIMPNEFVLIIGTGTVGLSAISLALKRGAHVLVITTYGEEADDLYQKLEEKN